MDSNFNELNIEMGADFFDSVVRSRRSVRQFLSDSIPEEVMQKCLNHAWLSPNSSNLQPWEFHWVRANNLKKIIAQDCLDQKAASTASDLIVCVAAPGSWKIAQKENLEFYQKMKNPPKTVLDYYQKFVPLVYGQGIFGLLGLLKKLIIFFVGLFRPVPRGPSSNADMKLWATKTTALACQTLMLSLRASGYDSCPMEGFDEVRVKKHLGLPCSKSVVMILGCGKRAPEGIYGEQFRSPDSRIVFKYF